MAILAIFLVAVIISWGCESVDKNGKDQAKISKAKDGKDKKNKSFDKEGKKNKKKGKKRDGKRRKGKKRNKRANDDQGQGKESKHAQPVELSQNAKVQVDALEYNFGSAEQYTTVEHSYVLTNTGTETLKIHQVKSSCGCTAAKPEKNELAPGEATEVKVTFNIGSRRGSQTKTVRVYTNSAESPELVLKLAGEVKQLISFDPQHLRFQNVEAGKPQTGKVLITYLGDEPLAINEISVNEPEMIKVEYDKQLTFPVTMKKDDTISLTVSLTLPQERNFFHGQLKILPEGKDPIQFYVSANLKGAAGKMDASARLRAHEKGQVRFSNKAESEPKEKPEAADVDTDTEEE